MVSVIPEEIWVLVFLVACTIFQWLGHSKRILLMQLIAFILLLAGTVWAFTSPLPWFIPLLFLFSNLALFMLDVTTGGR